MELENNYIPPGAEQPVPPVAEPAEEADDRAGREIKGLEPRPERFSVLKEGEDYSTIAINEAVITSDDPRRHIVFINPTQGEISLTVTPPHWRTITDKSFGAMDVQGGQREYFFEANTKGVGYLKPSVKGENIDTRDNWIGSSRFDGERILGICDATKGHPERMMALSDQLIRSGLRTEAHWMVSSLKRIPFRGEMMPLSELQTRGIIPRKYSDKPLLVNPIEVVRLIKSNTRIEEAYEADDRRQVIFNDAFATFNQEAQLQGQPLVKLENSADQRAFFAKFSERIGNNLAILLNQGMSHLYLHSSNISMAAEFLDIEPLQHWSKITKSSGWGKEYSGLRLHYIKDIRDATQALRRLLKVARTEDLHTGSRESLAQSLIDGFSTAFDSALASEQGINEVSARDWVGKIVNHLLVQRKNLPSLRNYPVEDWEILQQ